MSLFTIFFLSLRDVSWRDLTDFQILRYPEDKPKIKTTRGEISDGSGHRGFLHEIHEKRDPQSNRHQYDQQGQIGLQYVFETSCMVQVKSRQKDERGDACVPDHIQPKVVNIDLFYFNCPSTQ